MPNMTAGQACFASSVNLDVLQRMIMSHSCADWTVFDSLGYLAHFLHMALLDPVEHTIIACRMLSEPHSAGLSGGTGAREGGPGGAQRHPPDRGCQSDSG